jgi:hypothetical protein
MKGIISPEPERTRRKVEAAIKLIGDILFGRKKIPDAVDEYEETSDHIEAERRLDKHRKY